MATFAASAPGRRVSLGFLLLLAVWLVLAIRIGVAVVRAEPLGDDLALPTVALFVFSALLGSRGWGAIQTWRKASRNGGRPRD